MSLLFLCSDGSRGGEGGSKPTYGCQVTIQSGKEKEMMKMHRREEKRERKRGERRWDDTESSSDLYFDPKEMRAQR